MKRLFDWLDRVTTLRLVLALMVANLLLLVTENTLTFPLSVPSMRATTNGHVYLDMCAFCSSEQVYGELDAFGDVGRRMQAWLIPTIDVAIPVTSFAFGSVALTHALRGKRGTWTILLRTLPLVALLLDFAENAGIVSMLVAYPMRLETLATLTGLLSGMKFCAYAMVLLATLVASTTHLMAKRRTSAHLA
jgi:hypothetical protein